jgi:hypothetical protein
MILKVCGISNQEDADAAVAAGANAIGFNFYPRSPRYAAPESAEDGPVGGGAADLARAIADLEVYAAVTEIADGFGPDVPPETAELFRGALGARVGDAMQRDDGRRFGGAGGGRG